MCSARRTEAGTRTPAVLISLKTNGIHSIITFSYRWESSVVHLQNNYLIIWSSPALWLPTELLMFLTDAFIQSDITSVKLTWTTSSNVARRFHRRPLGLLGFEPTACQPPVRCFKHKAACRPAMLVTPKMMAPAVLRTDDETWERCCYGLVESEQTVSCSTGEGVMNGSHCSSVSADASYRVATSSEIARHPTLTALGPRSKFNCDRWLKRLTSKRRPGNHAYKHPGANPNTTDNLPRQTNMKRRCIGTHPNKHASDEPLIAFVWHCGTLHHSSSIQGEHLWTSSCLLK